MDTNKIIDSVSKLAKPIVKSLNMEFVETKYEEIEGERYITVVIYKPEGITFDDCKLVSKALDEPLDELNPTDDQSYTLNVSSLGLDRPIVTRRDFERYLGKQVDFEIDSQKHTGIVQEVNDSEVKFKVKNATKTFKLQDIKKATAHINF